MEISNDHQWVVTPDGIEGVSDDLHYWIAMERIYEQTERDCITYYNWPVHIAEKECVPVRPFIEAFVEASRFHARRTGMKVDEEILARSLKYAISYSVFAI